MSRRSTTAPTREIRLTVLSLCVSLAVTATLVHQMFGQGLIFFFADSETNLAAALIFDVTVLLLIYGNFVYQVARLGHYQRVARHVPASADDLAGVFESGGEPLVVLVPSYKEEVGVVRQTLLSAALQDYPQRNVVLLVDDPPHPGSPGDEAALTAVRRLPAQLSMQFTEPRQRFARATTEFRGRSTHRVDVLVESARLAALFDEAAALSPVGRPAKRCVATSTSCSARAGVCCMTSIVPVRTAPFASARGRARTGCA